MTHAMLIRNVEVDGNCQDVLVSNGVIKKIDKDISFAGKIYEGNGAALIPGLHDHHIHLNATAAAMNSVPCGPPEIFTEADLINALHNASVPNIRGVGYHQSVAGDINRDWLDKYGPQCPIRIQHRSGRLWILNSLAMTEYDLLSPKNGRLLDGDIQLRPRAEFPDLTALVQKLLSYGITGVTEVTPSNSVEEYAYYQSAAKPLRLKVMGQSTLTKERSQHLKLHYHDHDLPALETLATEIKLAHKAGRNIAAHCVTRAELMLTLAALEMAGPVSGDRIEHAAIADEAAINWMRVLGVIVVTQPNFITERYAAYIKDVPKEDHDNLWRLKAFQEAGLKLSAGSDAPFGNPNPWKAMQAAVHRPKGFEAEAVTAECALSLYTKPADDAGAPAREIGVGSVADMCLLDRKWCDARRALGDVSVNATWINGELVYDRVN